MSRIRVAEMLAGGLDPDIVLHDHLRHNIYPPVPEFTEGAREAIDHMANDEPDAAVRLPNGNEVTAAEVVAGLHLEVFLTFLKEEDSE